MIRTTPFHERTSALNETGLWEHWSNHLAAVRYQASEKFEYFAVRNSAGLFDSSPLYKYRITGSDAATPSTRSGVTTAGSWSRTASCSDWAGTSSC
jgi:glycine cleavage system aminomethyltransferase T